MSTPSISTINSLGIIYDEDIKIDNKLTTMRRPLGSTENTTVINIGGKQRLIILQGIHTGEGYGGATVEDKINAFITDMEDWVNTNLQTAKTFTDSFGNSYSVLCAIFQRKRTPPGNRILYTLTMIEGGALSAFNP